MVRADLYGVELGPVLEAEGIAELTPRHELVEKLFGPIAAVLEQVPRHLEGRDHPEVVVCCRCTAGSCEGCACSLLRLKMENESEAVKQSPSSLSTCDAGGTPGGTREAEGRAEVRQDSKPDVQHEARWLALEHAQPLSAAGGLLGAYRVKDAGSMWDDRLIHCWHMCLAGTAACSCSPSGMTLQST